LQRIKVEEKIKRDAEMQKNITALQGIKQTNASNKGFN